MPRGVAVALFGIPGSATQGPSPFRSLLAAAAAKAWSASAIRPNCGSLAGAGPSSASGALGLRDTGVAPPLTSAPKASAIQLPLPVFPATGECAPAMAKAPLGWLGGVAPTSLLKASATQLPCSMTTGSSSTSAKKAWLIQLPEPADGRACTAGTRSLTRSPKASWTQLPSSSSSPLHCWTSDPDSASVGQSRAEAGDGSGNSFRADDRNCHGADCSPAPGR
mmetsp:Transcript_33349/g.92172  ORF Transcript_33349/g.92172 Transcript_33349/m.92172 type:complete len:222 (+) Transcript_33349:229-894(+)